MRKFLIFIVLGFSSLAALASVQPAFAADARHACQNIALQQCNLSGGQCTTGNQYLALYNQCVRDPYAATTAVNDLKQHAKATSPAATARNITTPRSGSTASHSK